MPGQFWIVDKNGKVIGIDEAIPRDVVADVPIVMTAPHNRIHEGVFYTASKSITLPVGGSANILITTLKSAMRAHFIFQVISDDVMTVNFFEAPDYSGGTSLTAFNRDRNSPNTPSLALTHTSVDDGGGTGTLIWTFSAGANKTVTASESERYEFILAENTKYLLQGVGAQNDILTFLLDWYKRP